MKKDNSIGCLLGIGLLQQGYPKDSGRVASWKAEGGVYTGKEVINGHFCPVSLLPKTKLEGAAVPAVAPLRLAWRQHLQTVKVYVSTARYSERKCFWYRNGANTCCPTLFSRCLFLSKKEQAQRNQQSPSKPCFAWPKLMSSGKSAGDWQISWSSETDNQTINKTWFV